MIKHMAIIMDGNRRWARSKGFLPMKGHSQGVETAKKVLEFCLKKGIRYVSLYTFSIENFNRPETEKSFLFNLLVREAKKLTKNFLKKGIRIRFVGDRSLFPKNVQATCDHIEKETAHLDKLTANLLFCYGGRQEIVAGTKKIACQVKNGQLHEDDINEEILAKNMWMNGAPSPDILIRTGGEKRLSNFLLYQAAYSELYFLDALWPAVTEADLKNVCDDFSARQRRFGK